MLVYLLPKGRRRSDLFTQCLVPIIQATTLYHGKAGKHSDAGTSSQDLRPYANAPVIRVAERVGEDRSHQEGKKRARAKHFSPPGACLSSAVPTAFDVLPAISSGCDVDLIGSWSEQHVFAHLSRSPLSQVSVPVKSDPVKSRG